MTLSSFLSFMTRIEILFHFEEESLRSITRPGVSHPLMRLPGDVLWTLFFGVNVEWVQATQQPDVSHAWLTAHFGRTSGIPSLVLLSAKEIMGIIQPCGGEGVYFQAWTLLLLFFLLILRPSVSL